MVRSSVRKGPLPERAPARIGQTAQVHRSLISHGCIVDGTVVNSVLSPGVRIEVGAVVRDSILMFDTIVRRGAIVDRSIIDKEAVIGQGAIVGDGGDDTPNRREPTRLNSGISVVGKRAMIPRGARIGRNVKVGEGVRLVDFSSRVVKSGGSVERSDAPASRSRAAPVGSASGSNGVGEPPAIRAEASTARRARD